MTARLGARSPRHAEGAQATVEFALVLPLLMALIWLGVESSLLLRDQQGRDCGLGISRIQLRHVELAAICDHLAPDDCDATPAHKGSTCKCSTCATSTTSNS